MGDFQPFVCQDHLIVYAPTYALVSFSMYKRACILRGPHGKLNFDYHFLDIKVIIIFYYLQMVMWLPLWTQIFMDESSKFQKSWTFVIQNYKTCSMPSKYYFFKFKWLIV